MIIQLAERLIHTRFGPFQEHVYYDGQKESIALVKGNVKGVMNVLCRIHSHCLSAHVFNSIECDCREQMEISQQLIQQEGKGVVIWLDQEGKGNGHLALVQSKQLMRGEGLSQVEAYQKLGYEADARTYIRAAEILIALGVASILLLTNNPEKIFGIRDFNIPISDTKGVVIDPGDNEILKRSYADKAKIGHLIPAEITPTSI